ncbi:MAG: hypothetical protein NE330_05225 [Lentisphaeraceae bacterium]|nr:hypothetical protein [Lentisphaeraceae bacterium]
MSLKLLSVKHFVLNMQTRIPFKYGITTLRALPHLFVEIELSVNGQIHKGISSEGLAPKWFTKNPETSTRFDIEEMLEVVLSASKLALEIESSETLFGFWLELYKRQENKLSSTKEPLLYSFGVSLIERALISAFCESKKQSFSNLLRSEQIGFRPEAVYSQLPVKPCKKWFNFEPCERVYVRHTVGLADIILNSELSKEKSISDGLPETLEDSIKTYHLKYFKIKLFGDLSKDIERLQKIAKLIQRNCSKYSITLDGNEFFTDASDFKTYWETLSTHSELKGFLNNLLFVEQALHRNVALSERTAQVFNNWAKKPKMIIDEADGKLKNAQLALNSGYVGTSHKNCKGVFKGLANFCLTKHFDGILSGEDLCNVGPVALIQDLAVGATLGLTHIERNGHHYMKGLSMYSQSLQEKVCKIHSDLYENSRGFPALNIQNGQISLESINKAPFGLGLTLDMSEFTPLSDWDIDSLFDNHS